MAVPEGPAAWRVRAWWCYLLLTFAALPLLSACSAGSSDCDQAAEYVRQAKLSQAADLYAKAQRSKQGSCASDGLEQVTQLQAKSLASMAEGHAAESAGDLRAAQAAYESALAVDQGNTEAAAGMRRVVRRPANIGPIWLTAQRLHDEGYDSEARAEVINVLTKYPHETVPESLAGLSKLTQASSPASPPPTETPAATQQIASSAIGGLLGWMLFILFVFTVLASLAAWRAGRRIRSAVERTGVAVAHIAQRAGDLESAVHASRLTIDSVRAGVERLGREASAEKADTSRWLMAAGGRLDDLAVSTDQLQKSVKDLEMGVRLREREIRQLLLALEATRESEPDVMVELYEQAPGRHLDRS